ncbi:MAG: Mur ligase family protein [Candidatus Goldbacteria bacterium]|nr:Mur ligase family protein [Candidatus Goldiibacteriota bacterium]
MNDIYKYLQSLNEFKFDFSLDRIKKILKYLNNPQNNFKVIHITGSNGKGTVAHFLSSIFVNAGYKTGLYTSPHLIDVRERIKIDNKLVNKKIFNDCVLLVKKITENKNIKLTYFEFLTVVAFLVFKRQQVKIAIIEVGLGGRYDATNVDYKNKILSIITSIDLEHTNYLGKTKKLILLEKEKIIGDGFAVCNIKEKRLKKLLVKLHGRKILFPQDLFEIKKTIFKQDGLEILITSKNSELIKVKTKMLELIQTKNVLTVLTAIHFLNKRKNFHINDKTILTGIEKTFVPCRFTKHKKGYYLSVAHNPAAIEQMLKTARLIAGNKRIVYIYSSLKDKDINSIFRILSKDKNIFVILTQINNERAIDIEKLKKNIVKYCIKHKVEIDNFKALKLAYKLKKDGIIVIGGSFYLVNRFI